MDLCYSCLMAHPANPLTRSNPFNHLVSSDWRSILQLSDMSLMNRRAWTEKHIWRRLRSIIYFVFILFMHITSVYIQAHCTEQRWKYWVRLLVKLFYPNYKKYQIYFQNLHFFGNLLNILLKFESKLEKNVNWEKYFLKFK